VLEENLAQVHQVIFSLFGLCYNIVRFYYQQHHLLQPFHLKVRTRTIKYAEISLKEKHIVNIPLVLNIRESWVNRG
jgi:hypothetical protein